MFYAGSPLPDFETGFTPWDEYSSFFESVLLPEPGLDQPVDSLFSPDGSSSGSDPTCYHAGLDDGPNRIYSSPDGSDPTCYHAGLDTPNLVYSSPEIDSPSVKNMSGLDSGSGSDEPVCPQVEEQIRPVSIMEERKRKRKLSNRESARRSRMRKRTELENVRDEVNQMKIQNRQLGNQLRFANHHLQTARMDNNRLRVESLFLQSKLTEIAQFLHLQAIQQSYTYLQ